jgi:transcriptional regulator with XRE-family HTH domain
MAQKKMDLETTTPGDIEKMLGRRLLEIRLARNINQTDLAEEAGISRRTMTRLENGEGVSLDTLIRVMRALGLADRLAVLLPDPAIRPIERVRQGKERQRARRTSKPAARPWRWDDTGESR